VALRSDPTDATQPRLAATANGFLAAWEDARSGSDNELHLSAIDANGAAGGDALVETPMTGDANWPAIAWSGATAAVAYYQYRSGPPQIFLTRFDGAGTRLDGADLQVSSTPSGARARFPAVAWSGSAFGVAWVDTRNAGTPQIYFARVTCP
jgi:hypothetical protein